MATVGGFADDLGIAVDDLITALPLTVSFFKVVKLAAGLQLNLKKTQVLNLSRCTDGELGDALELKGITGMIIAGRAKYLG
eukprot:4167063-Heterocapsa_arctica.AAC.1